MKDRILSESNNSRVTYLRELESVMETQLAAQRRWFRRRPSMSEIGELCHLIADAKVRLWQGVYEQYPEAATGNWFIQKNRLKQTVDEKACQ